ncbi:MULTISPECIES: hypothetical protein [Nostocales]|uniref:Uncharacterized protein n=3 Tax=Nostocales TaxID=1161 RepID=A0A8S9T3Y7_9CYAN|nr:hypothetical protein [Tolypothrix bouteillei]KAF3886249.1 hypothetical protein DA73_0400012755 [Tolypothrix bouteillei VB521301]
MLRNYFSKNDGKSSEKMQKLGRTEANRLTASETILPLENIPTEHSLEIFMESFGA